MSFFGMGGWEIMVILVIALIIFGPGKLPEIGAQVGKGIRDFRAATRELTGEFERTINEVETAADEVKDSAREVHDSTMATVRLDQAPASATTPADSPPQSTASRPENAETPVPTKADPLADLVSTEEPEPVGQNGAVTNSSPHSESEDKAS